MATFQPQGSSRQGATQNVTIAAAASTQSTAFGSQTYQIRVAILLTTAGDIRIKIGDNPTAAATDTLILASSGWEYFVVSPGQKLATFGVGTAAGLLSLTEMM